MLRLTADDGGYQVYDEVTITVQPGNAAPTVAAGAAITFPVSHAMNLHGVATDDGLPSPPGSVSTTWSKVSGPGSVTFGSASAERGRVGWQV